LFCNHLNLTHLFELIKLFCCYPVHTVETAQDFAEDKFEDPDESLQHKHNNILEDLLNGKGSLFSNKEEILPRSTTSVPTEDKIDLSTHMIGKVAGRVNNISKNCAS
jgi:hypothetical protein